MSSSVTKYYDMLEDQEWERQQSLKKQKPKFNLFKFLLRLIRKI